MGIRGTRAERVDHVLQVYRQALRQLMQQAMSHDDDKMLRSAHLQLSAMLENKLVDFSV